MSFDQTSYPDYSQYIALSRYARYLDDKGRRETWEETVARYVGFFLKKFPEQLQDHAQELQETITTLNTMPSMRTLMTAGEALERDNVAGYNCSYLAIDRPRAFDEAMYVLMCGTGVGYSVERNSIDQLPEVGARGAAEAEKTDLLLELLEEHHPEYKCIVDAGTNYALRKHYQNLRYFPGCEEDEISTIEDNIITVKDSKIGWASAFRILLTELWNGNYEVEWDTSLVRPAGERLVTFGGRSSGPGPLVDLFQYSKDLFTRADGRKLTDLECSDLMCKVAEIVVVGGVRRSALICLSNLTSDRMATAKTGQFALTNPERFLANFSAVYTEKPDMSIWLKEWKNLYDSKSGERGIFSRVASQAQAARSGRRDINYQFGTNPCCFTGDMRLLTSSGYQPFESLAGRDVTLINKDGAASVGSVWVSGEKEIVELRFSGNKDSITCTPDHVFMTNEGAEVEAKDLRGLRVMPYYTIRNPRGSSAFKAGFIQGDGNTGRLLSEKHKGIEVYFSEKDGDIAKMFDAGTNSRYYSREAKEIAEDFGLSPAILPQRELPSKELSRVDSADFLSGLYSANGCVIKSGKRVALKATCKALAEQVKEYLELFGITAYITTNKPKTVKFDNGEYLCKQSYDVNISRHTDILKFAENISFGQAYKRDLLEQIILETAPMVRSVHERGTAIVYDYNEPLTNWGVVEGVVVHNSEIILRSQQFCNLSEVVVRPGDTFDSLKRKVELATILGTLQASLTDFRYLSEEWKQNTEEEALLGVSLTGIMDHPVMSNTSVPHDFGYVITQNTPNIVLMSVLEELKNAAIETNREWASKLGINPSTAITCVKPSGTVSQLVDSSSGIHPRHFKFYIRRAALDKKDPLGQLMIDEGVPYEEDNSKYYFMFPMKAPSHALTNDDVDVADFMKLIDIYNEHWCEHKVSCTIGYKTDEEFDRIGHWIYQGFDRVSGVSFFPHSDHVYAHAPYEELTEEGYEEMLAAMPERVRWERLPEYEQYDQTTGTQTLACSAGGCEI